MTTRHARPSFAGGRSLVAVLAAVILVLVAPPAPASADQPANDDSVTSAEKKWCLLRWVVCAAAWKAKGEAEAEAKKLFPEHTLGCRDCWGSAGMLITAPPAPARCCLPECSPRRKTARPRPGARS